MSRLKVTLDISGKVLAAMKNLSRDQVLVGIPSTAAEREPDPDDPEPINNAAIGFLMENGSPAQNLPARPHVKPGIMDAKDEIIRRYETGGRAILEGRITDPDVIHEAVGIVAENAIKAKIADGQFVPLSPRTLAARRRKGRTSEKPLQDTGQYRNAITHVIRPKA